MISIKGSFRIVILFIRLWQDIILLIVSISQTHSERMKSVGKSGMEPGSRLSLEASTCFQLFLGCLWIFFLLSIQSEADGQSAFWSVGRQSVSHTSILFGSCQLVNWSVKQSVTHSVYLWLFILSVVSSIISCFACVYHTWKMFLMLFLTLTFFHYLDIADSSI